MNQSIAVRKSVVESPPWKIGACNAIPSLALPLNRPSLKEIKKIQNFSPNRSPHHYPSLRPHIKRAWERSSFLGCDPSTLKAGQYSLSQTISLLKTHTSLIKAARPFLKSISKVAPKNHSVTLANQNSIVLDVIGDPSSVQGAQAVPGPGAIFSEALTGASGISIPLIEGTYTDVVGPEHYIKAFRLYTCQGIPIRSLYNSFLGVISIAFAFKDSLPFSQIRELLICAAKGTEAQLIQNELESSLNELSLTETPQQDALNKLWMDLYELQSSPRYQVKLNIDLFSNSSSKPSITKIRKEASRLAEIFKEEVQNWLEVSSNEIASPYPQDLNLLLQNVINLLKAEAALEGIQLFQKNEYKSLIGIVDRGHFMRTIFKNTLRIMDEVYQMNRSNKIEIGVEMKEGKSFSIRWNFGNQQEELPIC